MEEQKNEPTIENVREWVKRDMSAAHYFLGILMRYPDILDSVAEQIIAHVKAKENGAAIDSVTK